MPKKKPTKYDALKKPKRKNSRAIGNRFQRKVSDILNENFNTTDFQNTPGSGAFATTHTLPEHLQVWGDLITPQHFRFVIECKFAYEDQINDFYALIDTKSKLYEFIEQVERDAKNSKKEPLLIYAQRRKPLVSIIRKDSTLTKKIKEQYRYIDITNTHTLVYLEDLLKLDNNLFFIE